VKVAGDRIIAAEVQGDPTFLFTEQVTGGQADYDLEVSQRRLQSSIIVVRAIYLDSYSRFSASKAQSLSDIFRFSIARCIVFRLMNKLALNP
jgi:hypothetical protein